MKDSSSPPSIYMDFQATTPVDPVVLEAMAPYWNEDFGNPHSSKHAFGWRAEDAVATAREQVADLVGAVADEIVFTSGATEANNLAILGLLAHRSGAGRNVVVSAIEHKCVLESARQLSRFGYEVRIAPVTASGHVDMQALPRIVDRGTDLVSVMLVNNEIGTVQPIAAVAALAHAVGAVVHCDAAQAPTGIEFDTGALGVDLLSLSSHKMYGPKGIGALFVSRGVRNTMRPTVHGGGQEGGLRSGTLPTPLCVGFGEAVRIVMARRDDDAAMCAARRAAFVDALRARLPGLIFNGAEPLHPGHLNVRLPGIDADNLTINMQPLVAVSTGAACSSGIPEPSHVLRAIGLDAEAASECVRVGFGRSTTEEDVRRAATIMADEAERLIATEGLKIAIA